MARSGITQMTVRMKDSMNQQFDEACKRRGQTKTGVLLDAVAAYLADREPDQRTSNQYDRAVQVSLVANRLADAVSSYLRNNPDWASAVVESSKLPLPGDQGDFGFSGRMKHFSEEKAFLASNFVRLLRDRIWHQITVKQRESVTLVCDSGTTLYWFLNYLPSTLRRELDANPGHAEQWKKLRIVTNNLSGIEAFMRQCALNTLKNGSIVSDIVGCFVVPGKILPVYEAVTGPDANAALQKYRDDADAEFGERHVMIGLVTGNWLRLTAEEIRDGKRVAATPVPLARGSGHAAFKQTLIKACHEVYNITPLGKLLIGHSVEDLNNIVKYKDPYGEVCDAAFLADEAIKEKVLAIRLVSTLRVSGQLLANHSVLLQSALRSRYVRDHNETHAAQDFRELPHFLYTFDYNAQKSQEEQRVIEFPHENTRSPEFAELFSVSA
jgi:hypothetical protein